MPSLTNSEKFVFIAMKPDKPGYRVAQSYVNLGVICGAITDLVSKGDLELRDKKLVPTRGWRGSEVSVQDMILKEIATSKKQRTLKRWISGLNIKANRYRHKTLDMLKDQHLVRIEKKKFLFIPYRLAFVTNRRAQQDLISEIRETLLNRDFTSPNAPMLSLMNAFKMHKLLARYKSEQKRMKTLLKEFDRDSPITDAATKVLHEMQAAAMAAITVSTTAGR